MSKQPDWDAIWQRAIYAAQIKEPDMSKGFTVKEWAEKFKRSPYTMATCLERLEAAGKATKTDDVIKTSQGIRRASRWLIDEAVLNGEETTEAKKAAKAKTTTKRAGRIPPSRAKGRKAARDK